MVAQAERDLDLHKNMLRKRGKDNQGGPAHSFPVHGQQKSEQAVIAALKREIKKLRAEWYIIKSRGYFASESK